MTRAPKPRGGSPYAALAVYGAAGLQLAVSVVAGLLIGTYLDGRFGSGPWLAVAGLILGFAGGMTNLIMMVRALDRGGDGGSDEG